MNKLPSRFSDSGQSPGYQLWRVTNIWQRQVRQALKDLAITHVQFVLLAVTVKLGELGEPVIQAQVADAAGTDKMMTSQVLRTLEEKGLIVRAPDPTDARAILVSVTNHGYELTAKAIRKVEDADHAFFSILGEDERLLARLLSTLGAVPVLHPQDKDQRAAEAEDGEV